MLLCFSNICRSFFFYFLFYSDWIITIDVSSSSLVLYSLFSHSHSAFVDFQWLFVYYFVLYVFSHWYILYLYSFQRYLLLSYSWNSCFKVLISASVSSPYLFLLIVFSLESVWDIPIAYMSSNFRFYPGYLEYYVIL